VGEKERERERERERAGQSGGRACVSAGRQTDIFKVKLGLGEIEKQS
jgi:hypothetical protein